MSDTPLVGHLSRSAQGALDTDEREARGAAEVLGRHLGKFHVWHMEMEEMVAALKGSVSTSARARQAYSHLGVALDTCHVVVLSLCNAQDALEFRWGKRPSPGE